MNDPGPLGLLVVLKMLSPTEAVWSGSDQGAHCMLQWRFTWTCKQYLVAISSWKVRHWCIKCPIPHSLHGQAMVVDIQAIGVDPDQTAPRGAVWSGSTLLVACFRDILNGQADDTADDFKSHLAALVHKISYSWLFTGSGDSGRIPGFLGCYDNGLDPGWGV